MEFLNSKPAPRLDGRYDRGFLPHVRAQGRSYFVTFRLKGTLPQEVLRQYQAEREALLAKVKAAQEKPALRAQSVGMPVGKPALRNADILVGKDGGDLPLEDHQRLFDLCSDKIETYLDAGRGECWLKDARIAELVAGALRFFHGQRNNLGPWVVMPNHVHVIVRPLGEHLLDQIVKSWKGFTA